MQQFVLEQNIVRSERLLAVETDERRRELLRSMLAGWRRELSVLRSQRYGTVKHVPGLHIGGADGPEARRRIRSWIETSRHPCLLLDPRPGLRIVDMSAAYARATMIDPAATCGEKLFRVFPDNPDDALADGVSNLFASLAKATETRKPHRMNIQRYDVRDELGRFVPRYWNPVNTPLCDGDGLLMFLLHEVEEVATAGPPS